MDWLVHGNGTKQCFPLDLEYEGLLGELCGTGSVVPQDPKEMHRSQIRIFEDLLKQREFKIDVSRMESLKQFASKVNVQDKSVMLVFLSSSDGVRFKVYVSNLSFSMIAHKTLKKMMPYGLTSGELCVNFSFF